MDNTIISLFLLIIAAVYFGYMIYDMIKIRQAKRMLDEISMSFQESLRASIESTQKLRNCYEPTYAEIKDLYQKYIDKKSREEVWDVQEPMTLEEYLDEFIDREYYGNNLYEYCISQCAMAFTFDPNTGARSFIM